MGPKGDHSGHHWWKLTGRLKRSKKHKENDQPKHESDRSECPENVSTIDDPWTEAFGELSPGLQAKLQARGIVEDSAVSMQDKVEEFKQEA